jgi:AmmeMemoRadiSam system protein B
VWLKSIHAERENLRIVPVLVGPQLPAILDGRLPDTDDAEVADFIAALRELRAEYGERIAFVASVDLAHVGPIYGDPEAPDAERLRDVTSADRRLLEYAAAINPEGWVRFLHAEKDERNVCGAAPTYVLLAALAGTGLEGRLLRHDIWEIHPETHSHVSFATVAFTPRSTPDD